MSGLDEAVQDVTDAKQMGLDAFALNVQQPSADFTTSSVGWLFEAANQNGFKLFFSFDMTTIGAPSDFLPLFNQYVGNAAYYQHENRPFVSTFDGGAKSFGASSPNQGWQQQFKDVLSGQGINPFFVPDFDDYTGSAGSTYDSTFFSNYGSVDGVFSWESAWPEISEGLVNVSNSKDQAGLQAAHAANKVYMMPLSSLQFKHIDSGQNWYRIGELNLPERIGQVLALQPDFVEIITWNDAGESHYIGNNWPEAISGAPAIQAYSNGYDHTSWQDVLAPFITAYKAGKTSLKDVTPFGAFAGAYWYRPLLKGASCSGDSLGKPQGWESAQDTINIAVLLPSNTSGTTIRVTSGGNVVANLATTAGLNYAAVPISTGAQKVELVDASGNVLGAGSSTQDVVADTSGTCNFNYQVVHIA
ncbi:glycoside hydrolase [Dichomitus squalens LYAD-421 SS1]|uniref:Glycoside hydrolase n=1 Tax=Dichomitus squalens (strain LYAD-421) TaxID=732165 RepID=R7T287_DICSQ|nr:glycoside hydrolase [Dichomitus squalens LYAD-421 SS1]EJF61327.1 glycoside hydrolase [Dichomitus squalens LYAD-421 SS1]